MKTELLSAFGDEEKLVNFSRFFSVEWWWPHMACMGSRDSSIENRMRKSRDGKVRLFFGRDFPWNGWRNRTVRGTCWICFALFFKAGIYEVHCNALEHGCRKTEWVTAGEKPTAGNPYIPAPPSPPWSNPIVLSERLPPGLKFSESLPNKT